MREDTMKRRINSRLCGTIGILLLPGCAASRMSSAPVRQSGTAAASTDRRNIMLEEDIGRLGVRNALQALARLRPDLLRPARPWPFGDGTTFYMDDAVTVYFDGERVGGVEQLRWIRADAVKSMRFLPREEAAALLGRHPAGVLAVTSK
jgi:hypothetical protein